MELNVDQTTIGKRLHAMGKIQKLGKWVPHQMNENQLNARTTACRKHLAEHNKHSFLSQIINGDEKWVYYENPKRKASYFDPGQPLTSIP